MSRLQTPAQERRALRVTHTLEAPTVGLTTTDPVIPAKAGVQSAIRALVSNWAPACAGATRFGGCVDIGGVAANHSPRGGDKSRTQAPHRGRDRSADGRNVGRRRTIDRSPVRRALS